jgi:uncharacterized FAD-dependent dehydrogenase
MALQLREVTLDLHEDESVLPQKIASYLGLPVSEIHDVSVLRRGIDARKKPMVKRVYTLAFSLANEEDVLSSQTSGQRLALYQAVDLPSLKSIEKSRRVLVVGMGPAGLFAAQRLSQQGVAVTLVERGDPVEERVKKVNNFWVNGIFDPRSNVQFGEGGAGTFSDGKLTTRIKSPWNRLVLQSFVDCGAPDDILVEAKPHLGTDVLRRILINFRKSLQAAGVEILFQSSLTDLEILDGQVRAGVLNDSQVVEADAVVLAPGHSSRETYAMLDVAGVKLEQKPFAVGFRVEHPVALINEIQYGMASHANLPAADYALSYNDPESGRGVYSFCMCPGGEVIAAPSEESGMVVNGMSAHNREQPWSNSALVASVGPADFNGSDALAGVRFQQHWERLAFAAGGSCYRAPAQNLLAFLGQGQGPIRSTCRPGVNEAELDKLLPPDIIAVLRRGLPQFNRRMKGFVTGEAVLVGIESRTSAPLRILRNDQGESVSHAGLYPCGEGAGYAGGIMSAALDGIKIAEKIVDKFSCGVTSGKDFC